jgi:hypothetical protein
MVLCCSVTFSALHCQGLWNFGLLPEVTLGHRVSDDWKFSFQVESMQETHRGLGIEGMTQDYRYVRTDLTGIVSLRLGPLSKTGFGYMYRITGGEIVHRAIQQYAWVRRYARYRVGHRIRTDQTWQEGRSPVYRARYRWAADIPLSGQTLDPGELYTVPSLEQLGIISSGAGEGETRFMWRLGILAKKGMKFEMGIDHRWNGYVQNNDSHQNWWMINAFIDL